MMIAVISISISFVLLMTLTLLLDRSWRRLLRAWEKKLGVNNIEEK